MRPGIVGVGEQVGDEDPLVVVVRPNCFLGGLGDDGLVGFAVDHHLPAAFPHVKPLVVVPEGQAPLFKHVDAAVHVAGHVVHQVLAGDAHHVVADVLNVVLGLVPAVPHPHVHVDGGQPFADGAAAVGGGLVHHDDAQVVAAPVTGFDGRAAAGHAAADDQDVGFNDTGFGLRHLGGTPQGLAGCR